MKKIVFNITHVKRGLFWLLYIGLSATSILFVQETITDYKEAKTGYHSRSQFMTIKDIPSLTFCFEHLKEVQQ